MSGVVKSPLGRVDVLAAGLIRKALDGAKPSILHDLYAAAEPGVKQLLRATVGPRTRRGRQIAANLFAARDAVKRVQDARARRQVRV